MIEDKDTQERIFRSASESGKNDWITVFEGRGNLLRGN